MDVPGVTSEQAQTNQGTTKELEEDHNDLLSLTFAINLWGDETRGQQVTLWKGNDIRSQTEFCVPSKDTTIEGTDIKTILNRLNGTNALPSKSEIQVFDAYRKTCRDKAAIVNSECEELQSEILGLCEKLAKLGCKRKQYLDQAAFYSSFHAPIRRLPPELLAEIFAYTLPDNRIPDHRLSPMLLCQVSTSWRQVALTHPELWDGIQSPLAVPRLESAISPPEAFAKVMEMWFARSHSRLISLSLCFRQWRLLHTQSFAPCIANTILRYTHRFKDLAVAVVTREEFDSLISIPHDQFKALETLSLCIQHPSEYDWPAENPIKVFQSSPLRKVSLDINPPELSSRILLPWGQLTHLDILDSHRMLSITDWRGVMQRCTSLTEASFSVEGPAEEGVDPGIQLGTTTNFDHLRSLLLVVYAPGDLGSLFRGFYVPTLEHLHLFTSFAFHWEPLPLGCPINTSTLRTLTLSGITIPSESLFAVLRSADRLEILKLSLEEQSNVLPGQTNIMFLLVEALTITSDVLIDDPILLPHLQTLLTFHANLEHSPSPALYASMIKSRTTYPSLDSMDAPKVDVQELKLVLCFKSHTVDVHELTPNILRAFDPPEFAQRVLEIKVVPRGERF